MLMGDVKEESEERKEQSKEKTRNDKKKERGRVEDSRAPGRLWEMGRVTAGRGGRPRMNGNTKMAHAR